MIDDLLYMREEEKLARDVYLTLDEMYASYGINIFLRIAASEQSHMDAIAYLLDKLDIVDPVIDDSIGVFTDPQLQAMYDELIVAAEPGIIEALSVGVVIEETDIADLQECLAVEDLPTCIVRVYSNLLRGSLNHLNAFNSVLDRMLP